MHAIFANEEANEAIIKFLDSCNEKQDCPGTEDLPKGLSIPSMIEIPCIKIKFLKMPFLSKIR